MMKGPSGNPEGPFYYRVRQLPGIHLRSSLWKQQALVN